MKCILFLTLIFVPLLSHAQTAQASHHCQIYSIVSHYDLATMKLKFSVESKSDWFDVTSDPHENQKNIEVQTDNEVNGAAKVWTGTLLRTSEGDLIQAHADFMIEGAHGSASLFMSLDSRLAKSSVVLEIQTAAEFLLIPVDLKCEKT